jgi:hypothetical protein
VTASLVNAQTHALRGQGAVNEHGFAVDSRHASAVVRKIDDIGLLNGA